jgi:hypothetical protein
MKYKIRGHDGWKTVSGTVVGFCGYRQSALKSFYWIDHIPTGRSLLIVNTRQQAEIYVKALEYFHLNYHGREAAKYSLVGDQIARICRAIEDGRFIGAGYRRCAE